MNTQFPIYDTVSQHMNDVGTGWSLGVFGAVAEFVRDPGEEARLERQPGSLSIATARGALRVVAHRDAQVIDYTTPSRHPERRTRGIAFCLPEAAAGRSVRSVLRALGPDGDAVRPEDRAGMLFDIGLATPTLDACIRTTDPELIARLMASDGVPLFTQPALLGAIAAAGPHRVFMSALGRVEVFQPIPPPDGRSPEGPHTHLLPKLLAHKRGHAANIPIPAGLAVCLSAHPHSGALGAHGEDQPEDQPEG